MPATKKHLAGLVSRELGIPRSLALKVINSFMKHLAESVCRGERVELRNFGVFGSRKLERRKIIHPKTGESILAPPRKTVRFKPGKRFKDI